MSLLLLSVCYVVCLLCHCYYCLSVTLSAYYQLSIMSLLLLSVCYLICLLSAVYYVIIIIVCLLCCLPIMSCLLCHCYYCLSATLPAYYQLYIMSLLLLSAYYQMSIMSLLLLLSVCYVVCLLSAVYLCSADILYGNVALGALVTIKIRYMGHTLSPSSLRAAS